MQCNPSVRWIPSPSPSCITWYSASRATLYHDHPWHTSCLPDADQFEADAWLLEEMKGWEGLMHWRLTHFLIFNKLHQMLVFSLSSSIHLSIHSSLYSSIIWAALFSSPLPTPTHALCKTDWFIPRRTHTCLWPAILIITTTRTITYGHHYRISRTLWPGAWPHFLRSIDWSRLS